MFFVREVIYHGKLPDPFIKEDGSRMTKEEWQAGRRELFDKLCDIEYGGMPPKPEYIEIEPLCRLTRGAFATWYRIHVGTKEKQICFTLELNAPYVKGMSPESREGPVLENEKYPVVLTGDGCYKNMELDVIRECNRRGFIAARFNRLEIANDLWGSREGGIHTIYEGDYSDISAWAWGYSVCMDVFERLPYVDETEVAITGHSRGGKTVMLAAAYDERIKYVCPNNSGCHGAVSHRVEVKNQGENGDRRTETIPDMFEAFPTWMGKKLEQYANNVDALPYDMHYFGALIAPRYYLQCEGLQDYWINPIGAWNNASAVKECYKYLGAEGNAASWFREGAHRHKLPDYTEFLNFIEAMRDNKPLGEQFNTEPYPELELNFDWRY